MCIFIVLIFVLLFVGIGITNVRSQPTEIDISQETILSLIFYLFIVFVISIVVTFTHIMINNSKKRVKDRHA